MISGEVLTYTATDYCLLNSGRVLDATNLKNSKVVQVNTDMR